jgi:hypothetical protein
VIAVHIAPFSGSASAQSHFADCTSNTGDSASIILSAEINPTIDGVPFVEKTEIAVYTGDGACAGAAVWTGNSLSITAWGDDIMTPSKDGYAAGESMKFRVWDPRTSTEYGVGSGSVTITYNASKEFFRTDGRYSSDAIYSLSVLAAESESSSAGIAAPVTVYPTDGSENVEISANFEWLSAVGATRYRVQIHRALEGDSMSLIIDSIGVKGTTLRADLDENTSYYWRVRASADGSRSDWTPLIRFQTINEPTSSADDDTLPDTPLLDQNYPNPFNPETTIPFELPKAVAARLTVFDMLGKEVAVLADDVLQAGAHEVRWNADNVPSGMYVYVLQTPTTRLTRTLVLVK